MESTAERLLFAWGPSFVVVVATSVAGWYFNRRLEAFKHDLLTKVNARKLLLEKEMEFYARFFKAITELRDPLLEFTASVIRAPEGETRVDREQNNYSAFEKAYNELYEITLSYRPFYPEDIYVEAENLLKACYRRLISHGDMISQLVRPGRDTPEMASYQRVKKLSQDILALTDQIIITIRARIESY